MGEGQNKKWNEVARQLRVQPSDQVWNRLEKRLDQDRGKVRIQVVRKWIGIAATLLILITVGFYSLLPNSKTPEMLVMQELEEPTVRATFAAYKYVSDINGYYASEGWKQIHEGMHKPIVASPKIKALNQAPSIRIQEDTTM